MAARARAAQGDTRAKTQSRVGTGKHGGVSEKVVESVEVRRYWPGKAPRWVEGGEDAAEDDEEESGFGERSSAAQPRPDASGPVADRRLQRLAEGLDEGGGASDRRRRARAAAVIEEEEEETGGGESEGEGEARRRRGASAVILEAGGAGGNGAGGEASEEEEDDDAIAARRERLLAMKRRRAQEEEVGEAALEREAAAAEAEGVEEAEVEQESEYETDDESEEEGGAVRVLMKPVFVGSSMRETIKERDARLDEEEAARAKREVRIAERADESRQMLVQIVQREEGGASAAKAIEFADMPDDDDEPDELEQFDKWKVRELKRVKREREEARAAEIDAAEVERRRGLTDAERKVEDEEFAKMRADFGQEKAKWKFLQRYYHKGAFYQDEDETGNTKMGPVLMQDFGAPTGRDTVGDKSAMPAPMQVKNFGMRSQVKWTHLKGEDTSQKDALWNADRGLAEKSRGKTAGYKAANDFDRPTAKRKKPTAL